MELKGRGQALDWICYTLLIIGAFNWAAVGIAGTDLVVAALDPVFQPAAVEIISRTIYVLIGIAGLYFFYPLYRFSRFSRGDSRTTGS